MTEFKFKEVRVIEHSLREIVLKLEPGEEVRLRAEPTGYFTVLVRHCVGENPSLWTEQTRAITRLEVESAVPDVLGIAVLDGLHTVREEADG